MTNCNESVVVEAFTKDRIKSQPLYDYLTMERLTLMSKVLLQSNKFIKLEDEKWERKKEKVKETRR